MQNNTAKKLMQIPADHLIVGIDPHKRMHAVVIMTQQAVVCGKFRVNNSLKGFEELVERAQAAAIKAGCQGVIFAIEAGGHYWRNLGYYLHERGFEFRLVNPFTLKRQREGEDLNQRKNDYRDATVAAELLRIGKFTETRLVEGDYAKLRSLHQAYQRMKREYTRNVNLCRALLDGIFPEFCRVFRDPFGLTATAVLVSCADPAAVASLSLDEFIGLVRRAYVGRRLLVGKLVELHRLSSLTIGVKAGAEGVCVELQMLAGRQQLLREQIGELKRRIVELIQTFEEFSYVGSITGLGALTVAGLVAEIGPIEWYGNARDLVKLAGVNPTQAESADKARKRTPMSKKGRPMLRLCLWEAALGLLRCNEEFGLLAKRLEHRGERGRSLCRGQVLGAAMNKLLRLYFALASKKRVYEPAGAREVTRAA